MKRAARVDFMDADKALKIVRALADGRDPSSGAPLARESVFQKTEVVRALFAAVEALASVKPSRDEADEFPNASASWSPAEEARMVASFEKGLSQAAIAREHGRTRGAIHSRLKRLGLIDDDSDAPSASQTSSRSRAPASANRKPADDVPF